jgi:hypothetical protein
LGASRSGRKDARRHGAAARSPRLEALASELCDAAERIGIRVRQERLLREVGYHTQSGLVRLSGEEILLLDSDLSPDLKVDLLVGLLRSRDLAGVELSDDARHALAATPSRRGRHPARPPAEPAPGDHPDDPGSAPAI